VVVEVQITARFVAVAAMLLGLNPRRIELIDAATMTGSKLLFFINGYSPLNLYHPKQSSINFVASGKSARPACRVIIAVHRLRLRQYAHAESPNPSRARRIKPISVACSFSLAVIGSKRSDSLFSKTIALLMKVARQCYMPAQMLLSNSQNLNYKSR